MLQNKAYEELFGTTSQAAYLKTLVPKGVLLSNYYAVDHASLPNYLAAISGQQPNADTQAECGTYTDVTPGTPDANGQAQGQGCVYPAAIPSLPDQLVTNSLTWKGYIEGMDRANPAASCRHPDPGQPDPTNAPGGDQGYTTHHDPFVYFHSLTDQPACAQNDLPLTKLADDLKTADKTVNFSLIVPDLCHGGHDAPCADGTPGGVPAADAWLKDLIPKLQGSPAYKKGGLIVITSDQAPAPDPNQPPPAPDANDAGGGKVGALLLSDGLVAGATDDTVYSHYSLLRTIEDLWGLSPLGKAKDAKPFVSLAKKK
jgi:hypothetical protein